MSITFLIKVLLIIIGGTLVLYALTNGFTSMDSSTYLGKVIDIMGTAWDKFVPKPDPISINFDQNFVFDGNKLIKDLNTR